MEDRATTVFITMLIYFVRLMRKSIFLIFFINFFLYVNLSAAENKIITCEDNSGNIIYTDRVQTQCKQSKSITQPKISTLHNVVSVKPYKGKFSDQSIVRKNIVQIQGKANRLLKKTLSRLGMVETIGKIDIYFTADFKINEKEFNVITYTSNKNNKRRQIILFNVRHLMFDSYDIEKKLIHELTHAVMRDAMRENYRLLPRWFREGIAVWSASQIESKKKYLVSGSVFIDKKPLLLINGLEGKHTLDDYLEDGLFFEYIESQYGHAAVKSVVQLVIEGVSYQQALESVLKNDWEKITEAASLYAKEEVSNFTNRANFLEYHQIKNASTQLNPAKVKKNYQDFIKRNKDSVFVPNAMYQLGKVNIKLKQYSEAGKQFEAIVANHSRYTSLFSNSLYHRGAVFMKEEKRNQAKQQFDQLLTIFPETNYKKLIQGWLKQ